MKRWTKEINIALTTILAIIVLFFGIKFLKGKSMLSNNNTYYALFHDINGLSSSNPVLANGYQVGIVQDIKYDYEKPGNIVVALDIDKNLQLPAGTTAEIDSDFMGNVKLNLLLTDSPLKLTPGDTISGHIQGSALAEAAKLIPTVEKILPKLDSIMIHLNNILSDPAIKSTLHNADHITSDLTTSTQQLNTLLAQLNNKVPGLMTKADGVLDNTNKLTGQLADADLAQTVKQLDQTIANLKNITGKLNDKDGSLGLLMNDPELYNNLTKTLHSADTLLNNLREHPKRYVHFSVFGKKDK